MGLPRTPPPALRLDPPLYFTICFPHGCIEPPTDHGIDHVTAMYARTMVLTSAVPTSCRRAASLRARAA